MKQLLKHLEMKELEEEGKKHETNQNLVAKVCGNQGNKKQKERIME